MPCLTLSHMLEAEGIKPLFILIQVEILKGKPEPETSRHQNVEQSTVHTHTLPLNDRTKKGGQRAG